MPKFNDETLLQLESFLITLLQRHNAENQLRCSDETDHQFNVAKIDRNGFVTAVTCTRCNKTFETVYHGDNWTYEKIYDPSLLRPGDHICWHRVAIWHHAIVTGVDKNDRGEVTEIHTIHYNNLVVEEKTFSDGIAQQNRCNCNTLYRVNYHDCYSSDYTVLRAKTLLYEMRYNLLKRNCEHFSRWCKTGSKTSSQVSMFWTSLGKLVLTVLLKAAGLLVVLGLLQYAHESQEGNVRHQSQLQIVQNRLLSIYIVVMTLLFVVYLLKTSCSRLGTVILDDSTHPCWKLLLRCFSDDSVDSCFNRCMPTKNSRELTQYTCCILMSCYTFCQLLCCGVCKHVQCCPCICYRRHGHLAFGLFARIFIRELIASAGTTIVILNEDLITDCFMQYSPAARTSLLMLFALVAHIVGYIFGILIGRWVEGRCHYCCRICSRPSHRRLIV